jgi:hypothetical protein
MACQDATRAQRGEHVTAGAASKAMDEQLAVTATGEAHGGRLGVLVRRAEGEAITAMPVSAQGLTD